MKIAYVSSSNSPQGGAELCLLKLARHFKNSIAILPNDSGIAQQYSESGLLVESVSMKRMRSYGSVGYHLRYLVSLVTSTLQIARLIRKYQIDIVHANELIDLPALFAGRITGIHTVCHIRTIIERPRWFKRFICKIVHIMADRIICVSQAVKKDMFDTEYPDSPKLRVIYDGGPDLTLFDPHHIDPEGIRNELGIAKNDCLITLISKFVEVKGQKHFLGLANRLSRDFPGMFKFLLVGGPVDGHESYYNEIKQLVADWGLGNSVLLIGYRNDIPSILLASDIFVHLPLYQEPFPGVVLEAMAMGVPVVAYRSGGIPEQITDSITGLLVEQGNIDLLASQVVSLNSDPDWASLISQHARQEGANRFTLSRHFSEVSAVYEELYSIEN